MGMPAAKQNDLITAVPFDMHIVMVPSPGGPVPIPLPHPFIGMLDTALSADVKIGGMPAATKDSIAHQTVPHIPTPPGTAFQKPPMNEGKVMMGSMTVKINGKDAARMGDTCMTCNDPSDLPVGKVMVVQMILVFIGDGGGGGGGGDASGGSGAVDSASASGAAAGGGAGSESSAEDEDHWVQFDTEDSSGRPVGGAGYEFEEP